MENKIIDAYRKWLMNLVTSEAYPYAENYQKLSEFLMNRTFFSSVRNDENRASDGVDLRSRFFAEGNYPDGELPFEYICSPCSVLEMMVALAIRCENDVMGDLEYGDRTSLWFWIMVENLGFKDMVDDNFDLGFCSWVIDKFLHRKYNSDGSNGGMFIVRERLSNLRKIELWYQMHWFLEENFVEFQPKKLG